MRQTAAGGNQLRTCNSSSNFRASSPEPSAQLPVPKVAPFYRRHKILISCAAMSCALAAVSFAQEPLQINVPYRCANGISYTILNCKPYRNDQSCTWREEQNGREVVTAVSLASQMTGRLQGCTVPSAAKPATSQSPAPQPAASTGTSQPLNPAYLKEFPTVDQVLAKLTGTDANDTTNLHLGAFREFKQMIQDLAGSRWYRNQLTPDETRIFGDYDLAYNKIAKPLNFPLDGYFGRGTFISRIFTTFSMTQVRTQLQAGEAEAAQKRAASAPATPPNPSSASTSPVQPVSNDPGAIEIRRCLELGGSQLDCLGKGVGTSFWSMFGVPTAKIDAATGPAVDGLRMTGMFKSSSGITFVFSNDSVSITNCGKLLGANHPYAIQPFGNQFALKIENQPQPIIAGLAADGKISAPAAADVAGQIITGYRTVMVETRNVKTNAIVPGSVHAEQRPVYGPKTEHCSLGSMLPGPASTSDDAGILSILSSMIDDTSTNDVAAQKNLLAPGARMAGTYAAQNGLKVQFNAAGAVIDCGQAHVAVLYGLSENSGAVAISVKNGASPFTLALQPSGPLVGSGTIEVKGRLLTGTNDAGFIFTPVVTHCAVGTLVLAK